MAVFHFPAISRLIGIDGLEAKRLHACIGTGESRQAVNQTRHAHSFHLQVLAGLEIFLRR
jgi:hypothetical protein